MIFALCQLISGSEASARSWQATVYSTPPLPFFFPVNRELRRFVVCGYLLVHSHSFYFSFFFPIGASATRYSHCLLLHALPRAMAECLTPYEPPGGALTAEITVHISVPQRRKASRPNYLDWIIHHQISILPLQALVGLQTQTDFCRGGFSSCP